MDYYSIFCEDTEEYYWAKCGGRDDIINMITPQDFYEEGQVYRIQIIDEELEKFRPIPPILKQEEGPCLMHDNGEILESPNV